MGSKKMKTHNHLDRRIATRTYTAEHATYTVTL